MFSKIKSTVLWASLLAIPVAAVVFTVKYYMGKQGGEPVTVEDVEKVVTDTVEFVKKAFRYI